MLPPIATASIALGRSCAGHTLPNKVKAAAKAGFQGLEVAIECLEYHAAAITNAPPPSLTNPVSPEALKTAAKDIRELANSHSISLFALQPLTKYDSLNNVTQDTIDYIQLWVDLAVIIGASIVQIPTITYPMKKEDVNIDRAHIAENIARLADMAASHNLTIGYEAPAWGIACETWQEIDDIIKLARRPNVKHCLDTFHIAAVEAGDATRPDTNFLKEDAESRLSASLKELRERIKPEDIAYFQLSDANIVDLSQKDYPVKDLNQPLNMTWSRNCRIFPCEPEEYGGVLPALDVCRAVFDIGFTGWVSMEVFHTQHYDPNPAISDIWAERGMASWKEVIKRCELS